MIWVRKAFVFLLSLVLFVSLASAALSYSTNQNLTHTAKLETWLGQSHVYDSVVNNALNDAQQNSSNDAGAGRVSLSDPAVVSAVKSVFSPSVIQQYTTTFLNSNYAWLQGKTGQPDFRIDLTPAKQKLAQQIGQDVQTRIAGLSPCTAAQLSQLQSTLSSDPLSLPCRLPDLSAQTAGQQAAKQIAGSSDFLNNPVITASSINPNGGNQGQPYYQRLSRAPKLYQLNQKLPIIFAVLAILCILGILWLSPTRRRALRRLGWVLLASGLVLVIFKFAADSLFGRVENKIFSNSNIGQLQKSLTSFIHFVESQLVKTDMVFGLAFLILAIIILAYIWFTRNRYGNPRPKSGAVEPVAPGTVFSGEPDADAAPRKPPVPPLKRPRPPIATHPPKRPRLIQ
jgi:hypothetical protein